MVWLQVGCESDRWDCAGQALDLGAAAPVARYARPVLGRVSELTADARATRDLRRYLASYRGAKFNRLVARRAPDEFTIRTSRRQIQAVILAV